MKQDRLSERTVIALFTRVPVPGKVKTRLIPALGAEGACALHEQLLGQTLGVLQQQHMAQVEVWIDQPLSHGVFDQCGFPRVVQQGADLGERMQNAMQKLRSTYQNLIFIGSDCPKMDEDYLQQAIQALQSGKDIVLGPALDGGYVLIALSGTYPELFSGITWGSDQVLRQTLDKVTALGLKYALLSPLADIDHAEDLKYVTAS